MEGRSYLRKRLIMENVKNYTCVIMGCSLNVHPNLKNPTTAHLKYNDIQEIINYLNEHPEILTLNIRRCSIDDTCADILSKLKFITNLYVSGNPINIVGMNNLLKLQALDKLFFSPNINLNYKYTTELREVLRERQTEKIINKYNILLLSMLDKTSSLSLNLNVDIMLVICDKLIQVIRNMTPNNYKNNSLNYSGTLFGNKLNSPADDSNENKVVSRKRKFSQI